MSEKGPIYGVELIDVLPVGSGSMRQAMPSRMDLNRVLKVNQRTVAGYEVLLASWRHLLAASKAVLVSRATIDHPSSPYSDMVSNTSLKALEGAIATAEATP